MKIAYVLNTYPQPSHSFIRRELQALEHQGVEILRLAMRPSAAALADPQDQAEAARTGYVLQAGAWRLLAALAREAASPVRFAQALRLALKLAHAAGTGLLRHLIYLGEAAYVKQRCAAAGVQHMHAHFGTNAAAVAMLAHALGGPGYSFTVHGPEEFDAPQALSLGEKINRAAFTVAVSSFGKSQLSRWAAFGKWDSLKVVHCGIEPDRFADPAPLPQGPLRLVAIGRFVEQKGQMVLVNAMARLVQEIPDVHLSLVGDGGMRPALEAAIAAHGLQGSITLTGWLAETEVQAELASSHALVMPSFAEGLPMVVMEAMAAARPVIATFIAGTPELVVPGQTGWLLPAGDEGALAQTVITLAQTPHSQRTAMGQAGRRRVLGRHDSAAEAAKLAAHFRKAIAG
ncbi:glycosyltransferase [Leisingera sp. HS039]|uniref:glycosyltransferase n=1 Tax=unclassified Leisingera TaxID=2614906 RepID=UPI0010714F9C|nr:MULTISPECIES: glycosyltransferase [unclassified Leisingera]MBQ4827482.1 glycosyltransferase [Leisingera sp. HS039]QBR35463.1 colanic acid biosynthesis glycosyltransferase WcaL [Leisingera sp. NJS201]